MGTATLRNLAEDSQHCLTGRLPFRDFCHSRTWTRRIWPGRKKLIHCRATDPGTAAVGSPTVLFPALALLLLSAADALAQAPEPVEPLEGTSWQLVRIQSMDDAVFVPADPALYTVRFRSEGRLQVQSDCNRAGATWVQEGSQLRFEGLNSTQALCNPGSLHNRFISNLLAIASFVRRDGHLFLATWADGAILEFEPLVFSPR